MAHPGKKRKLTGEGELLCLPPYFFGLKKETNLRENTLWDANVTLAACGGGGLSRQSAPPPFAWSLQCARAEAGDLTKGC